MQIQTCTHLPCLLKDPKVEGSESRLNPLFWYFLTQLYTTATITKEMKLLGKTKKENKTKPYLGFSFPLFRACPLRIAASPDERPENIQADRQPPLSEACPAPNLLCGVLLGLCLLNSFLILLKKPGLSRLP